MTSQEAKQKAVEARINFVKNQIESAVEDGKYELDTANISEEGEKWLNENGYVVNKIMQRDGYRFNIKWE